MNHGIHPFSSGRETTGTAVRYAVNFSSTGALPRTKYKDPPTERVRAANHNIVVRCSGGATSRRNKLSEPMQDIVRLRKRNTGAVKSGVSFNSPATSMGVFRFLKSSARAAVSPRSNNMLRKNMPKEAGMMYATC